MSMSRFIQVVLSVSVVQYNLCTEVSIQARNYSYYYLLFSCEFTTRAWKYIQNITDDYSLLIMLQMRVKNACFLFYINYRDVIHINTSPEEQHTLMQNMLPFKYMHCVVLCCYN